jgi:hypothetical protein
MSEHDPEEDQQDEQIRRREGRGYEEREGDGQKIPRPADDPDPADVPPLTEPGAEE